METRSDLTQILSNMIHPLQKVHIIHNELAGLREKTKIQFMLSALSVNIIETIFKKSGDTYSLQPNLQNFPKDIEVIYQRAQNLYNKKNQNDLENILNEMSYKIVEHIFDQMSSKIKPHLSVNSLFEAQPQNVLNFLLSKKTSEKLIQNISKLLNKCIIAQNHYGEYNSTFNSELDKTLEDVNNEVEQEYLECISEHHTDSLKSNLEEILQYIQPEILTQKFNDYKNLIEKMCQLFENNLDQENLKLRKNTLSTNHLYDNIESILVIAQNSIDTYKSTKPIYSEEVFDFLEKATDPQRIKRDKAIEKMHDPLSRVCNYILKKTPNESIFPDKMFEHLGKIANEYSLHTINISIVKDGSQAMRLANQLDYILQQSVQKIEQYIAKARITDTFNFSEAHKSQIIIDLHACSYLITQMLNQMKEIIKICTLSDGLIRQQLFFKHNYLSTLLSEKELIQKEIMEPIRARLRSCANNVSTEYSNKEAMLPLIELIEPGVHYVVLSCLNLVSIILITNETVPDNAQKYGLCVNAAPQALLEIDYDQNCDNKYQPNSK